MKHSGLLIAFALIGYGLWKFTQTGSKSSGLGSPFGSSGTARVPSVLGAAKPGGAPVFSPPITPGPARAPAGGGSSFDLGAVGSLAKSAYDALRNAFRSGEPIDFTDDLDFSDRPDLGESAGNTSAARNDASLFVPRASSPAFVFHADDDIFADDGIDWIDFQGVDDLDTSEVGSIA